MKPEITRMRIDKWLWAVRLFKTRTQAGDACEKGRIILSAIPVKASRMVQEGDEIKIKRTGLTRTIKILRLTENRLSAKLITDYYLDQTPSEEIENFKARASRVTIYRDPGTGRPTKKDRRMLDDFFSED
ncbi:MAG: RNA-binding S4 domain-containing protein [Bacteroidetes bacterium]|nr:RNA-binding S4 domain-containing protein [Bacteroidota bacterium]